MSRYSVMPWEELRSEYRRLARVEGAARRILRRGVDRSEESYVRRMQTHSRAARHAVEMELRRREAVDTAVALETLAGLVRPIDSNVIPTFGPATVRHVRGGE